MIMGSSVGGLQTSLEVFPDTSASFTYPVYTFCHTRPCALMCFGKVACTKKKQGFQGIWGHYKTVAICLDHFLDPEMCNIALNIPIER